MANKAKTTPKPWDKQGISRTTFFNRKRKAREKAAAAGAPYVPLHLRKTGAQPPLVMERAGKQWRPVNRPASAARLSEAALPDAVTAALKSRIDTTTAVYRALAEHLRTVLLASNETIMLVLNGQSRMALVTYLNAGLSARETNRENV